MKRLILILCALLVAALIALKVTSHKENTTTQTAPEAQPTKKSGTLPDRTRAAKPPTFQATNADEKPLRQKLKEEGQYTAIFAKEAEWKEKFKELKKGMTLQEAVAVMGEPPTFLLAVTNTPGGTPEMVPFSTNALQILKSHAYLFYSPDGVPPKDFKTGELRPNRLPFDFFELQFDAAGTLYSMVDNYEDPRERRRRELSESPEGREMLAKEAEWKERSKEINEGMTIQEVIGAMGQPRHREQMPPSRDGYTFLYYLPAGTSMLEKSGGAFAGLTLIFDPDGRLKTIKWW